MNTITHHLRCHAYESACLAAGVRLASLPSLAALRERQWSPEFEGLMRNRLVMGAFRYGLFGPAKGGYDQVGSILRHLAAYTESGNLEHLVDIANLALVEFEFGRHPKRHWHACDDSEHAAPSKEIP